MLCSRILFSSHTCMQLVLHASSYLQIFYILFPIYSILQTWPLPYNHLKDIFSCIYTYAHSHTHFILEQEQSCRGLSGWDCCLRVSTKNPMKRLFLPEIPVCGWQIWQRTCNSFCYRRWGKIPSKKPKQHWMSMLRYVNFTFLSCMRLTWLQGAKVAAETVVGKLLDSLLFSTVHLTSSSSTGKTRKMPMHGHHKKGRQHRNASSKTANKAIVYLMG